MVDAVGWWEEECELIRYGKETSTVKQVDDLNCGTPMDSVSYSVNTENPQLYGCAGSDFRASCDGGRWFVLKQIKYKRKDLIYKIKMILLYIHLT